MNTQPSRFSQWIRTNLKDSYSGLIAQDIDFFIKNESNKTFVVEEKLYRNAKTGPAQAVIYKMIDQICSTNENFQGVFQISGLNNDRALLNQKEDVNVTSFFRDIENCIMSSQWPELERTTIFSRLHHYGNTYKTYFYTFHCVIASLRQ